jgi:hypothetical protein
MKKYIKNCLQNFRPQADAGIDQAPEDAKFANNKIFIYFVFVLAFFLRLSRWIPNMELVTTAMLLSSLYLSRNTSLKLTLLLMIATDLFLGNTHIFLFTWSGFLLPIILIKLFMTQPLRSLGEGGLSMIKVTALGIGSNLFFYLWTNFGVWLLDSWGMYPKTLQGLIHCYINGLPFLHPQLASTLLFVPLGVCLLHFITHHRIILDTSRETLFFLKHSFKNPAKLKAK